MKHDYRNKFDMDILKGKVVMAFTDPLDTLDENYQPTSKQNNYKYFTDNWFFYTNDINPYNNTCMYL